MSDEVIEELWQVKDDMARECGYDVNRLIGDLQIRHRQEGNQKFDVECRRVARAQAMIEGIPKGRTTPGSDPPDCYIGDARRQTMRSFA